MTHPIVLTRPNAADVFRWLGYLSWVGCAIFTGALITATDCQRSEHIASNWGSIVVLSMIFTYAVRTHYAQLVSPHSGSGAGKLAPRALLRRHIRPASMSSPNAAHLPAAIAVDNNKDLLQSAVM